jgi:hypothetical protein
MPSANPTVPIVFDNQTSKQVFVQFLNGAFGPGQFGADGTQPLAGNTAYDLATLTSSLPNFPGLGEIPNVALNDFTNGRIYLNFGSQGLILSHPGYQPAASDPQDPNYKTRYAFLEPNVFGTPANNLDLSYIDFFGVSLEASTWSGGKMVRQLRTAPGGQIIEALKKASPGTGAFVPSVTPVAPYEDFVRIIGPGHSPAYHNWKLYLLMLSQQQDNGSTRIEGQFDGLPGGQGPTAAQSYDLKATFSQVRQRVTLTGSAQIVGSTTITIDYADLNALTGIYGANPGYSVNGGQKTSGIVNDVYGYIVGDLLAGMCMGFPGSTEKNPTNGQQLGHCTSSEWFAAARTSPRIMYGGAQARSECYDTYAAALAPLTDGYGFPFTDRLGGNILLYFPPSGANAVDYLKITLRADQ